MTDYQKIRDAIDQKKVILSSIRMENTACWQSGF